MSYSHEQRRRRRALAGLGADLTTTTGSLGTRYTAAPSTAAAIPAWALSALGGPVYMEWTQDWGGFGHSTVYGRIGDTAVLNAMMQRIVALSLMSPDGGGFGTCVASGGCPAMMTARRPIRDWAGQPQEEIREDSPFIIGLRAFWVRMGRDERLWPSGHDFGPNTNNSKDLVISRELYEMFRNPPGMWVVNGDGYVRLTNNDYLWNGVVHDLLVRDGYLSRNAAITTKDDGEMVGALHRFYDEALVNHIDVGDWPTGFNFGPNTNGDEVRIPDKLLRAVLSGVSPRVLTASVGVRSELGRATIRAPIFGGLTQAPQVQLRLSADSMMIAPGAARILGPIVIGTPAKK